MNGYRELIRRKLLEQMYEKMSDEERRTFVQFSMQDKEHREIMQALQEINDKADKNRPSWLNDFSANIAGNAVFDGAVWLLSKLIRKL